MGLYNRDFRGSRPTLEGSSFRFSRGLRERGEKVPQAREESKGLYFGEEKKGLARVSLLA
jgi:hypothetical protein